MHARPAATSRSRSVSEGGGGAGGAGFADAGAGALAGAGGGMARCVSAPVRPRAAAHASPAAGAAGVEGPTRRTRSVTVTETAAAIAAVAAFERAGTPAPAAGAGDGEAAGAAPASDPAPAGAAAEAGGAGADGGSAFAGLQPGPDPAAGGPALPARAAAVANPFVNLGLANPFAGVPEEDGGARVRARRALDPDEADLSDDAWQPRSASAPLRPVRRARSGTLGAPEPGRRPRCSTDPSPSWRAGRAAGRAPDQRAARGGSPARSPGQAPSRALPTLGGLTPAASAPLVRLQVRARVPAGAGARAAPGLGPGLGSGAGSAPVGARAPQAARAGSSGDLGAPLPALRAATPRAATPRGATPRGGAAAWAPDADLARAQPQPQPGNARRLAVGAGAAGGGCGGILEQRLAAWQGDAAAAAGLQALEGSVESSSCVDQLLAVQQYLGQARAAGPAPCADLRSEPRLRALIVLRGRSLLWRSLCWDCLRVLHLHAQCFIRPTLHACGVNAKSLPSPQACLHALQVRTALAYLSCVRGTVLGYSGV